MDVQQVSAQLNLDDCQQLALDLVNACSSGDANSISRIKDHYGLPRVPTQKELNQFTRRRLAKLIGREDAGTTVTLDHAKLLVASSYGFKSWMDLAHFSEAVRNEGSSTSLFETAVDAVVSGDVSRLAELLRDHPELSGARSARIHNSTLLHYVAANGVEDFRQRSPANSVDIAKLLLTAGAEVDAVNDPGSGTSLGLVATSIHPAHAGVQIPLMETLIAAGASVDGSPDGWNPLIAALHNGRPEAAQFLASQGARLDLEGAAGVGRLDLVESFFDDQGLISNATEDQLTSGFMWACEFGHTPVVEFIAKRGFALATLGHGMPGLHWAIIGGRIETIRLLLAMQAPLEVLNDYGGNVIGSATWAVKYSDHVYRWPDRDTDWVSIVQMLLNAGANVAERDSDFPTGNDGVDALLRSHGMH